MKIKTIELEGDALDWAVGIAEAPNGAQMLWHLMKNGNWQPSRKWAEGGPFINKNYISTCTSPHYDFWVATMPGDFEYSGPTPLIAAMRCYVASKLGDDVEIPDVLCK